MISSALLRLTLALLCDKTRHLDLAVLGVMELHESQHHTPHIAAPPPDLLPSPNLPSPHAPPIQTHYIILPPPLNPTHVHCTALHCITPSISHGLNYRPASSPKVRSAHSRIESSDRAPPAPVSMVLGCMDGMSRWCVCVYNTTQRVS